MDTRCLYDRLVPVSEIKPHPKNRISSGVDMKLLGCNPFNMTIQSTEMVRMFFGANEIQVEYRDLHWFGKYKFFVVQGRGQSKYLIANMPGENRTIQLHQLIMNPPNGLEVDHINNNGLDNRRSNLRVVTHQTNQNNLPKKRGASSRFHGVSWDSSRKKWLCQVNVSGTRKSIGRYDSEVEAAVAYNNSVIKLGLESVKRLNKT